MYDLNRSDETQSITLGLDRPAVRNVRAEFALTLEAITPRLLVTPALLGLNIFVFLAMAARGVHPFEPAIAGLIQWGANYGPLTVTGGQWWRLVTSMFLHIGVIHLAFNMFVLWQAGKFVERLLGNTAFLVVYMVSGIAGALVSVAWHPYVVSAGASGAIFGLYGALLGYLALCRHSIPAEVLAPLTKGAIVFVGYNLIYGLSSTGTDVADHMGGLAAGFLCGLAMAVPLTVDPPPRRAGRSAAVVLGAAILCIGAAVALPRPVDIVAGMNSFVDVEKKVMAAFRGGLARTPDKNLNDANLADLIEKDVLPDWEAEQRKMATLKGLPPTMQRAVSSLLTYMEARRQGWSLLVKGLRAHDVTLVRAGMAKQAEAERLARALQVQTPTRKP